MGHEDPLPASPKCDKKNWYANLKSGVGFGGSVCGVGMNIEWRSWDVFYFVVADLTGFMRAAVNQVACVDGDS